MKNTSLFVGGALLLGGIFAFAQNRKPKAAVLPQPAPTPKPEPYVVPKNAIANVIKVLKLGDRGIEVQKLQQLMKITADGIFGSQTEATLYRIKGVKQISLDQYGKLPTLKTATVLTEGTKVIAAVPFATIYKADINKDGLYYNTGFVAKQVGFGQNVGVIKRHTTDGLWYSIYYDAGFEGTKIGFIKTSEIIK